MRPQQYSDALWWDETQEDSGTPNLEMDFPKLFSVQVGHMEAGRRQMNFRNGMWPLHGNVKLEGPCGSSVQTTGLSRLFIPLCSTAAKTAKKLNLFKIPYRKIWLYIVVELSLRKKSQVDSGFRLGYHLKTIGHFYQKNKKKVPDSCSIFSTSADVIFYKT